MQFFMPEHVFIWRILIKHENNKTTKKNWKISQNLVKFRFQIIFILEI